MRNAGSLHVRTLLIWAGAGALAVGMAVASLEPQARAQRHETVSSDHASPRPPLNINAASVYELEGLPRIGPVLARRIVEYRATHGPCTLPEDLLDVHGIGPITLSRMQSAGIECGPPKLRNDPVTAP